VKKHIYIVKNHRGKTIGHSKAHSIDSALFLARSIYKETVAWVETYEEDSVYNPYPPTELPEVIEGVVQYHSGRDGDLTQLIA